MTRMIADVARFMAAAGQLPGSPETSQLYLDLVREELDELAQSIVAEDRVEEADAVADTVWVLIGYALARGIDLTCIWDEVARSNLAKIDPLSGTVLKREDGKVIKPAGWQKPNIRGCLSLD